MMAKIDFFFNKVIPKKFIVFTLACIFLFMDKLTNEQWFYIALAYFGINVINAIKGRLNGGEK